MDIFKTLLIHNPPNLALEGQVSYQGTWDASANSPTLVSGIGTKGYYYVVSTSGSTNLDGVTTWTVGDWAIFNGTAWQKVDNTDAVNSVFGRTGAVVGVSTDYSSVGITNTAIGASNPSTGAFTTLSATGNLTASGGSITVSGGAYPNFYANGTTGGGFTIQKSGVSYGTFYGNDSNTVLDSAGSASLILQTGGATRATLTSTATTLTGNATVGGALTVSGKAASSGYVYAGGTLSAFESAAGLYSYYSGGGVIGAYSDGSGTRAAMTIDGTTLSLRPNGVTADRLLIDSNGITAKAVTVSGTTASTSTSTGALVVSGGVGVAGAINAGGNIKSSVSASGASGGVLLAENTAAAATGNQASVFFPTSTGASTYWQLIGRQNSATANDQTLRVVFGGVAQHTYFNASDLSVQSGITLKVLDTTASTSTSTGALVVGNGTSGGLGVGGMISVNGGVGVGRYSAVSGGSARVDINGTGVSGFPQLMVSDTTGRQWEFRGVNASGSFVLDFWNGAGSRTNNLLTISAGGNLGVLGNLTVSGTGGSSINGDLLITGTTKYTRIRRDDTVIDFTNAAQSAYADAQIIANNLYLKGSNGTGAYINASGNVLIGTTTDSSNGKLQLTSHTTSASGIGFGTETALYRAAAGSLVVDHIGGSAPTLNLSANGSIQSRLFFNGSNTFLESYTSHSLILRTNQTTALTLDSSQKASFAGKVAINGGDTSAAYLGLAGVAGSLVINFTNANTTGQSFGIRGFAGTNSSDYALNLRNAADSATLLKVDGAGGTTVGGVLTLISTDAKLLLNASGVATQKSLIASNGGASVNYNGLYATSNWTDGNVQANSGLSSWRVDVGGFDAFTFGSDQFAVGRAPAGSTTFSKLFTVTSNGNVSIAATTASTSTSTGALVVSGGVGVAGAIYAGGLINASGSGSFSTTTDRGGLTLNFPAAPTGSNGPAATFKTWTNTASLIDAGRIASIITDGSASYASKLEFSVANAGSLTTALTIENNSNATFAGGIKTVAPTSGTAQFWELGEAATVSPTSPNRTLRVEIAGTVYFIHAKTTND